MLLLFPPFVCDAEMAIECEGLSSSVESNHLGQALISSYEDWVERVQAGRDDRSGKVEVKGTIALATAKKTRR
ncbi:hypothetical protein [Microcoleus sp. FACHB-1515]|uniref:hypothetical protein n=1 Tax=Microcoleus sp. FACHB-1515 TaxID=2692821 RepID=UPI0016893126|nr:hypothetical protein [Microcoleus sp. FACHB-1515]